MAVMPKYLDLWVQYFEPYIQYMHAYTGTITVTAFKGSPPLIWLHLCFRAIYGQITYCFIMLFLEFCCPPSVVSNHCNTTLLTLSYQTYHLCLFSVFYITAWSFTQSSLKFVNVWKLLSKHFQHLIKNPLILAKTHFSDHKKQIFFQSRRDGVQHKNKLKHTHQDSCLMRACLKVSGSIQQHLITRLYAYFSVCLFLDTKQI